MADLALVTSGKLRVVRSDEQFTGVAAEAVTIGQVVRIDTTTGKITKSNATSAAEGRSLGLALRTAAAGEAVTVLREGIVDGWDLSGLNYDAAVYVSNTDGGLADAAGTVSVEAGRVLGGFSTTLGTAADKLLLVEFRQLESSSLSGAAVANVANANTTGGIPVLHRVNVAAGANADINVVLDHKTRVIDAWVVLTGAGVALATMTVKNGANAITNAMDVSGADKAIVRAAEIDDARHEIAAAGQLRVTGAGGATMPDCIVYVLGVLVA